MFIIYRGRRPSKGRARELMEVRRTAPSPLGRSSHAPGLTFGKETYVLVCFLAGLLKSICNPHHQWAPSDNPFLAGDCCV